MMSIIENNKLDSLNDKKMQSEFESFQLTDSKDSMHNFINLLNDIIQKIYNYTVKQSDIDILNKFLENKTLNVKSNYDVFYAFLIYTLINYKKQKVLHCIFINRFLLIKNYEKSKLIYKFLNVNSAINLDYEKLKSANLKIQSKEDIYNNPIIFTSFEEILYDYAFGLNIDKVADRVNIKFENAFIYDIERILFDYKNCIFKIMGQELVKDELKLKKVFSKYKKIIGVSEGLFYEKMKLFQNYNLKVENYSFNNNVNEYIKNPNNLYFPNQEEKIEAIIKQIINAKKEKKTVVIDIDNNEDLRLIENSLYTKKIKFATIKDDTLDNIQNISTILTEGKITLITNLIGTFIRPQAGGDYEKIAELKLNSYNVSKNTNFYREKYKKECKIQKEKAEFYAKILKTKQNLELIFASHYLEIKNEYLVINNYIDNILFENITFYNSPKDDLFKKFHLDNLSILQEKVTKQNEKLFNIISKFLYHIKKYSSNKKLRYDDSYIIYLVNNES